MTEAVLHFVWQHQYFSKKNLQTTDGQSITILRTGLYNTHAGADFTAAFVRIGEVDWVGSVEIHKKSSDWDAHAHTQDTRYNNVILHVVWQHDREVLRPDGSPIPTLTLSERVDNEWLKRCENFIQQTPFPIPCAAQIGQVSNLHQMAMFDRALAERLEQKAARVLEWFGQNGRDWEETTYWLLMQNMGFKTNAEPMLSLAQQLPLRCLQKHRDQLLSLEAMLFGVGGWIKEPSNDLYICQLQKEYSFLGHKYALRDKELNASQWKLLRMRPANFPTVRLAQMAAILHCNPHLFSLLLECTTVAELKAFLRVPMSEYWTKHYLPEKESSQKVAQLGDESLNNIIINTAVPLLVAYGQHLQQQQWKEKAISWLETLSAEKNKITDIWKNLGLTMRTAADAQAGIALYQYFCEPKRCLECQIGTALLRPVIIP